MKRIKLKLATVLSVLSLVAMPVVQVGTASAACAPMTPNVDDRTFGNYLGVGHDIVHHASENWAMRVYIGCSGTIASHEYKLQFKTTGELVFSKWSYATGKPVLEPPYWRSYTSGTANTLVFQKDGNVVIYNTYNVPVWASGTFTRGTAHYMHIRVDAIYHEAEIYYGGDGSSSPQWVKFLNQ